jgi:hypothetical protein
LLAVAQTAAPKLGAALHRRMSKLLIALREFEAPE